VFAAKLLDGFLSNLAFTQNGHDLLFAKSLFHHSPFRAAILYHPTGTFSGIRTVTNPNADRVKLSVQ
jgi:hypothetical protein